MLRHLGYAGATQSIDACTTRFCRPEEATTDRIKSLIRDNLLDLARILQANAESGIAFYRVSSRIIPYASHPGNALCWWDEFAEQLDRLGSFVHRHGLRLEMHPGQHCLLNAPSPETVALSILELGWHVHFFEAMRLDASHKLMVRVGGTFGDKGGALERFISVINGLPEAWRGRLAIENDGVQFGLIDVLDASDRTGLPVVLAGVDPKPDSACRLPDPRSVGRCLATWEAREGPAIIHMGGPTSAPVRSIHRANRVDPDDMATIAMLSAGSVPFDCLLEPEQGDLALLELRRRMTIREHGASAGLLDRASLPII